MRKTVGSQAPFPDGLTSRLIRLGCYFQACLNVPKIVLGLTYFKMNLKRRILLQYFDIIIIIIFFLTYYNNIIRKRQCG